jgi:hypothetical protein
VIVLSVIGAPARAISANRGDSSLAAVLVAAGCAAAAAVAETSATTAAQRRRSRAGGGSVGLGTGGSCQALLRAA